MIKPYKGRRSLLIPHPAPTGKGEYLNAWRWRFDPFRLPAISELARRLKAAGIVTVGGPVLSGALFAQAVEDAVGGDIRATYLGKPGYKAVKHLRQKSIVQPPWVFVDDIASTGSALANAAKDVHAPPMAAIFFTAYDPTIPARWRGVPILILRGRKRS